MSSVAEYELEPFSGVQWPEKWPFEDTPEAFARQDERPDVMFYISPRFTAHFDEVARKSITDFYALTINEGADVLDLCSSWLSHLPEDLKLGRVAGVGMNMDELRSNLQLTEYEMQDLNVNTKLPYEDASFDFVCNVVSVDYLIKPLEIFKEMHRVLRPGGKAFMSFSDRYFPSKAIKAWKDTDDAGHMFIVGSYFKFSADWTDIKAYDVSDLSGETDEFGDPMFIVAGIK